MIQKNFSNIQAVGFDFAHTLAYISPNSADLLANFLLLEEGISMNKRAILNAYRLIEVQNPYSSVSIKTKEDKFLFYSSFNGLIMEELGMGDKSIDLGQKFFYYLATCDRHWLLYEDVVSTIFELKKLGLFLFLASNFDSTLLGILRNLKIDILFDAIFCSQDMNIEKPSKEFYSRILKSIGMNECPSCAAFVGDSYVLDYQPSEKAGMHALLISREKNYKKELHIKAIDNLKQIPFALDLL